MRESKREYWALGLMTGTALDGFVDIALLKTDGEKIIELGPYDLIEYSAQDRALLSQAVGIALEWQFKGQRPEILDEAERLITQIYAHAIKAFLARNGIDSKEIDYIGAHGLTVLHHPPSGNQIGQTLQLLDGQLLADIVKIPIVFDFRSNDMMHGGQGAPLAPIYHAALLRFANLSPPCAILNLGGVANLTYWNGKGEIAAFDCGPANGPINEWVEKHGRGSFDKDGKFAAAGIADLAIIDRVMQNPWFDKMFPKSLDRYDFSAELVSGLKFEDGCATLSVLVAMAVGRGLNLFDARVSTLVVAGGGRKNPILMRDIAKYANVSLIDSDEIGLRGDAVEAECFAFLAIRNIKQLPISFAQTTGVSVPLCGGRLALPIEKLTGL